jgi:formylmethanofuran dehydrogenase subunit E
MSLEPIFIKDLGMQYPTKTSKQKHRFGLYKCSYCGEEFKTQVQSIRNGSTSSCGCLRKLKSHKTTHKLSGHKF